MNPVHSACCSLTVALQCIGRVWPPGGSERLTAASERAGRQAAAVGAQLRLGPEPLRFPGSAQPARPRGANSQLRLFSVRFLPRGPFAPGAPTPTFDTPSQSVTLPLVKKETTGRPRIAGGRFAVNVSPKRRRDFLCFRCTFTRLR
ncbi:hypothetical protein SKAU_G00390050 [Synaphobranchus kaupii]|uniref:Uncharacterized protein n=1 Tax=Synaphobranchus kaupii TaxID=118154 RepID=A0A9Q1EB96_SYNKA|nr:hypothetical protein SKAU_G00390050 [Synaphobranchus kaupii]